MGRVLITQQKESAMFPGTINDTLPDEVFVTWYNLMKLHEKHNIPKPDKIVFSSLPDAYKSREGGEICLMVSDHATFFKEEK